jgi:hypothetical protein
LAIQETLFNTQDYAISPGHVNAEQTVFRFLFLQVLWAAFVWNKVESSDFFDGTHWFASKICLDFTSLHKHLNLQRNQIEELHNDYENLANCMKECVMIMKAVKILKAACFPAVSS